MLFALAIVLVAGILRQEGQNRGLCLEDKEHLVSLYVDDMLLYQREHSG